MSTAHARSRSSELAGLMGKNGRMDPIGRTLGRRSTESPGRLRIVHVATRLIVGGMESIVASLVRGVPRERYESAVWCLEEADRLGQELRAEGHTVVELGKRRRRDLALFVRIARLVRRQRIDVLHCHDDLSWFYGAIGGRFGGVRRVVLTAHGRRADIAKRHLVEQRVLARLTTSIATVSSYLGRQMTDELRLPPGRVRMIPNGIVPGPQGPTPEDRREARRALGLSDSAMAVGWVGSLVPIKNVDLLIDAVANARSAIPALRLVLIGDGPCREPLARKAAALGVGGTVTFTGERRDVRQLLPGFDLYVCSSDYEGTSLSILEAMAAERAVIATAVGGNPEIVRHEETGILVSRGDRPGLARAIADLSTDSAKRSRLGRQARGIVQQAYSHDRMIRDYGRLYEARR